jgi:transmembrane sensor
MTPDREETTATAREQAALEWFVRLRKPHDAADRTAFRAWHDADRRNAAAFAGAEDLWRRTDDAAARLALDEAPALAGLLAAMERPKPRVAWRRPLALAAAAACLLIATAAVWLERPHLVQDLMADQATGRGEIRTVSLPDGSSALMDADSAITVDYARGERRLTLLRGAAFFSVVSNGQPFVVAAKGGETRVVGTQFEVRLSGERVIVTVAKGRVDVAPPTGGRQTLMPGQRLPYGAGGAGAVSSVDPADLLAWREGRLIFRRTRLDEAVEVLNRYRAGRIVLLDDALAARTVSGSFPASDTDGALDALRQVVGFRMDSITPYLVILRQAAPAGSAGK